jgi:hypothetical protein
MKQNLLSTLRHHLQDPQNGWSIGTFGAIAEFFRDAGEPTPLEELDGLTIATQRGAIRINLDGPVKPVAYETLSGNPRRWQQGLSICLPQHTAEMGQRNTLTELGPDEDSIGADDRGAILFDMGLSAPHVDVCIRTRDPELLAVLRAQCGRSILEPDNPAMAAIIHNSPHRVFMSRLGRIEIYQGIGLIETPEGPHTHVLPKLLASGRTHSANVPIPAGYVPCLDLYPANPLADQLGRDKTFEPAQYRAFQEILGIWGIPEYGAEKQRVREALREGMGPADYPLPASRPGRAALRVTLRQWAQTEGESPLLQAWRETFDRNDARDHDPYAH